MSKAYIPFLIIALALILFVNCTNSPDKKGKNKKSTTTTELPVHKGPVDENVFGRDLIDDEPSPRDIINEHGHYFKDTKMRLFQGTTLGYVTPWNNHGYDIAKLFAKKFDIISPVWLQVKREGTNKYTMTGTHDIDAGWIADVRKAGPKKIKIIPRVIFDRFNEHDYTKYLFTDSEQEVVQNVIVDTCIKHKFDGIVLELWPQLALLVNDEVLYKVFIGIADAMKAHKLKLILVISPQRPGSRDTFNHKHFETLYNHVYAFSLMTYDYSNIQRPGANAPLYWMRSAVDNVCPKTLPDYETKRKKILMGMNLYGNDYTPDGGGPIVGHQFLEYLKHLKDTMTLDEVDVENFFEVRTDTGRHYIFYPTLFSINERLKLARELGVGLSLWELGQGLDYFYDMF